ncbi:histone acetyltransferase type B catalytic subunit-like [Palaemon carinicauda]|uniref:histone acetyltransferase type B catalytic subunit-like n=1 Tax=Palaemon carinicauda TaxID=392227 RepID=UPI0035B5961A
MTDAPFLNKCNTFLVGVLEQLSDRNCREYLYNSDTRNNFANRDNETTELVPNVIAEIKKALKDVKRDVNNKITMNSFHRKNCNDCMLVFCLLQWQLLAPFMPNINMAGISGIARDSLEHFVIDSNEALEFKLVRTEADLENEGTTFQPEMSHQVYGDSEQIFGYSGLRIKLYYTACRLTTYLAHSYAEKVNPERYDGVQADEVIKPLAERLQPGYLTNVDDFIAALKKDAAFKPYGKMLRQFTVDMEDGEEKTFEVYFCDISEPGFLEYHERMQPFILWYIDAASYIDVDDDRWRFIVV